MLHSIPLLGAGLLAALALSASAAERRIAYAAEGAVWVARLDGSAPKQLAKGTDPEISPDGTRVAYTHSDEQGKRSIAIVDVASGERKIFTDVPGKNAYGPNWLPDGKALSFHVQEGTLWHLAWAKADGSGFRFLWRAPDADSALQGSAWLADGSGFFAYDLAAIHRFDAQGKALQKWPIAKLVPKSSFSAGGALSVSPGGRTLLVEVDLLEANPNKEDANPPSSIWSIDPAAGRAKRLTAKGIAYNASPRWLSADEILFRTSGGKDKKDGIVRAKLGGTERQLVVPKATYPSVSRE